jgi:hypothetical protein
MAKATKKATKKAPAGLSYSGSADAIRGLEDVLGVAKANKAKAARKLIGQATRLVKKIDRVLARDVANGSKRAEKREKLAAKIKALKSVMAAL